MARPKFEKGNTLAVGNKNKGGRPKIPEDIKFIRKQAQKDFLRSFNKYKNMPLSQLQNYITTIQQGEDERLSAQDAMLITFWTKAIQEGDPQRLKTVMVLLGIPTEIKAVGIQEVQQIADDTDLGRTLNDRKHTITNQEIFDVISQGPQEGEEDQDDLPEED